MIIEYSDEKYLSIQNAINKITDSDKEKKEIIFKEGEYRTGPIELVSNITLTLEKGARIIFYNDPYLYTPVWTRWEGIECYAMHPLVYAKGAHNITIRGEGELDGSGEWWWDAFKKIEHDDRNNPLEPYEIELSLLNPDYGSRPGGGARPQTQFLRPSMVQFWKCNSVRLEGITLRNSPFWTLHTVYSTNIDIIRVKIFNPSDAINTDAIDLDSSQNVNIDSCVFDIGDDAITLKSGSGLDGLRVNIPTSNVTAKNCHILASHGGIAIGSETAGGINNVVIEDCNFDGTQRAIRLKSRRGRGGKIHNIKLSNLVMNNCWCPIVIGQYFSPGVLPHERDIVFSMDHQPVNELTPYISEVEINNVVANNIKSTAAFIVGLPESPINNVTIKGFKWSLASEEELIETWNSEPTEGLFHDDERGVKLVNVSNVKLENVC